MKNSEVRIQESESRRSLRDAARTRTRESVTLSVGDSDPRLIEDHQIFLFRGGLKPDYLSTSRTEFILNSDS
ncbi:MULTISPECIES: hypothetical protein [unclassified Nostoc]|uniref:hypothetical protein n=1 Tax=unclassified Nostoc TaxID=2593658 RepID=UPI002611357C|nr:hypothetical protein [Nostoc sp. S13]MDF5739550.1 hypothetical protein [Nostoc sp. S13]